MNFFKRKKKEVEETGFKYYRCAWSGNKAIFKSKGKINQSCSYNLFFPALNIFVSYKGDSDIAFHSVVEITKEEYDKLLKNSICNCPVGEGTNIKKSINPYTSKEILDAVKNKFNGFDISFLDQEIDHSNFYPRVVLVFEINGKYEVKVKGDYYKKACLNCGTCFDEISKVYEIFQKKIDEIKEDKMVLDICK